MVRSLLIGIFAPGAAPDAARLQRIRMAARAPRVRMTTVWTDEGS